MKATRFSLLALLMLASNSEKVTCAEIDGTTGVSPALVENTPNIFIVKPASSIPMSELESTAKSGNNLRLPFKLLRSLKGSDGGKDITILVDSANSNAASFVGLAHFGVQVPLLVFLIRDGESYKFSTNPPCWMFVPVDEKSNQLSGLTVHDIVLSKTWPQEFEIVGRAVKSAVEASDIAKTEPERIPRIVQSYERIYSYQLALSQKEFGIDATKAILQQVFDELHLRPQYVPLVAKAIYENPNPATLPAVIDFLKTNNWTAEQRRQVEFILKRLIRALPGKVVFESVGDIEATGSDEVVSAALYQIVAADIRPFPLSTYLHFFSSGRSNLVKYASLYCLSESKLKNHPDLPDYPDFAKEPEKTLKVWSEYLESLQIKE